MFLLFQQPGIALLKIAPAADQCGAPGRGDQPDLPAFVRRMQKGPAGFRFRIQGFFQRLLRAEIAAEALRKGRAAGKGIGRRIGGNLSLVG